MKDTLEKEIRNVLESMGVENAAVSLAFPVQMSLGDYSTSIAMAYAKALGQSSMEVAEKIKEKLEEKHVPHIAKIEVVKPGFINFYFDTEFFEKNTEFILFEKGHYGKNDSLKGQKYIIEHTQPNPFKEFHIGHLMNNAIGESISRITAANGSEVKTASYHGDVGMHVAKAVWAMQKNVSFREAYVVGNKAYEESEDSKKEITEINKKIYEKSDPKINTIYELGRTESLHYFQMLYERLDSYFDYHFYESDMVERGKSLVQDFLKKGVFEESEGAVVWKGEKFGLHTRVFLNSEGLPTYEAKEIGLAFVKKNLYEYDKSLTITATEQDAFFTVVEKVIEQIFPELDGKLKHISHGMLRLPDGKMSSRTGNIITAEALIAQVKEKILEKMKDREIENKDEVAEQIAIAAIKYSILRQAIGGDIIFDFEKSLSFDGDSGPYLQYATVRANSLLKKAEGITEMSEKLPHGWQTTDLERMLERFPKVVARAGFEYAPHHIVTYLVELAGEFNSFYAHDKIIDAHDSTSPYRLALTRAFVYVMTSGLDLLGIKVPRLM